MIEIKLKNTTKNDISFSIPENYINNDFYIESESEKEFTIYVFPDIVCNYQFYSISERNKQFFIVFYWVTILSVEPSTQTCPILVGLRVGKSLSTKVFAPSVISEIDKLLSKT